MGINNKNNIVGTRIGIYDVLYECKDKDNDGHKKYHVKCSICGFESDIRKSGIKSCKKCKHISCVRSNFKSL